MKIKNPNLNQILIKKSITATPNINLKDTREILLKNKIRRLIICDAKKKPVGIITEKDIAKAFYNLGTKSIDSIKVKQIMAKNLVTLTKENTVYKCASLMKNNRISSIIIVNEKGTLEGLITKTDLTSLFLTQAVSPLKISEVMRRKVITAYPSDSILHVESLLIKYGISRVVIQRNGIPVGIITFRDFIPAQLPRWIAESADPNEVKNYKNSSKIFETRLNQQSYLLPFNAVDIMSSKPITVDADQDVGKAVLLMIRHEISGLPVVKKTKLVGLITKSDIVNAIAVA